MFPKLLQRLFANEGAGPKLRTDILPLDNKTLGVNGEGAVAVQLSDAVNSADSTTAATSKAVKTAYDKANSAATAVAAAQSTATDAKATADTARDRADAAYTEATKTASTTAAGRVQLSDAVDSTSSTTAATSKAVKTAYDKANSAATAVAAAQSTATAAKSAAATAQTKANSAYTLAEAASFPKGTRLLFHQAAAPTGWTKQTTVNDAALRVVSGTTGGGTGGSMAFSTLFAAGKAVTLSGNVGETTLTVAQLASHTHKVSVYSPSGDNSRHVSFANGNYLQDVSGCLNTGSSASHTHTLSGKATIALNVKYTDVIICAKA